MEIVSTSLLTDIFPWYVGTVSDRLSFPKCKQIYLKKAQKERQEEDERGKDGEKRETESGGRNKESEKGNRNKEGGEGRGEKEGQEGE